MMKKNTRQGCKYECMISQMDITKNVYVTAFQCLPFSGGSDDWAAGSLGIPFSFTVELPDKGRHGFILPATKIESTGREACAGLEAMVRELIRLKWI